jgi:predicted RNase H-like HicB family nuclease
LFECLLNAGLKRAQNPATLERMKLSVTLDRDEDGMWVVECPSIPGCVSQGKTKEQALKNIKEAIALCLEVRAERGLPLTVETRQVEVAV